MAKGPMVEVQNAVSPGHVYRVDAAKYGAMREAMVAVLPSGPPGMTVAEIRTHVVPHLPETLFPGGAKAGWWIKCVQLDLEAKKVIRRSESRLDSTRSEYPPAPHTAIRGLPAAVAVRIASTKAR